MLVVKVLFWASIATLVWTHAAYPVVARALARLRTRVVRKDDGYMPTVTVIVARPRLVSQPLSCRVSSMFRISHVDANGTRAQFTSTILMVLARVTVNATFMRCWA